MEYRFYLHGTKDKKNRHPVYIDITYGMEFYAPKEGRARVQTSTGAKCEKQNWEAGRDKVKTTENGAAEYNRRISKTRTRLEEIHAHFNFTKEPLTPKRFAELLKSEGDLKEVLKEQQPVEEIKTLDYYWQQCRQQHRQAWSDNYTRILNNGHNHLMKYKPDALPSDINEGFVREFFAYLNELWLNTEAARATAKLKGLKPPRRAGLSNNSLGQVVKYFRHVLKFAGAPYEYLKDTYYVEKETKETHTWEEVLALWNLNFEAVPVKSKGRPQYGLEVTRDIYVFVCLTGPRFSDTGNIDQVNIKKLELDGEKITVLDYRQIKNGIRSQVVLHPIAEQIIRKYKGKQKGLLPTVSNQTYNTNIKIIGKMAGFGRPVQVIYLVGKERIEETLPLHEAMSSHMARATWATNLLENGADITDVQAAGGWKDLATVRKYARTRDKKQFKATRDAFKKMEGL